MGAQDKRDATHPRARVLFVPADAEFGEHAKRRLAGSGIRVSLSVNGVDALQKLDQRQFDLALVDLALPQDEALRLIALIRGARRLAHLAIVVVAEAKDGRVFLEALAIGADGIAMKPIDWDQLAEMVMSAIAEKSMLDGGPGSSGPH